MQTQRSPFAPIHLRSRHVEEPDAVTAGNATPADTAGDDAAPDAGITSTLAVIEISDNESAATFTLRMQV